MRRIDPGTCVDHYTFWRLRPVGVEEVVELRDQFQRDTYKTRLNAVEFLGNPATKIRRGHEEEEDIHQAKVHLLAYRIDKPVEGPGKDNPPVIFNQFTPEGAKWVLGRTSFLLVPARKALSSERPPTTPPPRRVDHFVCYDVLDAPPVAEPLVLRDQFGTTDTHELRPVMLGVPADKRGEGLIHPDVHLAIYEMRPGLRPSSSIGVNTADQLRRWQLEAIESVFLGVPSHKEWKLG